MCLDDVREQIGIQLIPEWYWCEAFKEMFPAPDGKGPVGVADPSWLDRSGWKHFPYLHQDGAYELWLAGDVFTEDWRWLVFADPKA